MSGNDSSSPNDGELEDFYKYDPDYDPDRDTSIEHGLEVDGTTIIFYPSNRWSILFTTVVSGLILTLILSVIVYMISMETLYLPYTAFIGILAILGVFLWTFGGYLIVRPKKITLKWHYQGIYIEDTFWGKWRKRAFKIADAPKFVVYRTKKTFREDGMTYLVINFRVELHSEGTVYKILEDASEYGLRALQKYCFDNNIRYEQGTTKFNITPIFIASVYLVLLVVELRLTGRI